MNPQRSFPWDLASLIGNASALHVLYIMIVSGSPDRTDLHGLLIWWGVLTAAWFLMYAAGLLPVTSRLIPALAVCALACQIFLTSRFAQPPSSFTGWLWLILIWVIPLFRAAEFMYRPESPEQRTLDFEFCVLSLVPLVMIIAAGRNDPSALIPVLFACALTLLNLAAHRSSGSLSPSRVLTSAGTFLVPALLILAGVLLFLAVSGPLSAGIHWVTEWILSGIRAALAALGRFMAWLFSLLPQPEAETNLPEVETVAASVEMDVSDVLSGDVVMTPILLAFLGCFGAAFLLMGARRIRPVPAATGHRRTSRLSPGRILRQALQRLMNAVHFQIDCFRYRNTPEGLLCRVEYAMTRRHAGRKKDESPRSFLARAAGYRPDLAEDLLTLADWLDRRYFSGEKFMPDREEFLLLKKHLSGHPSAETQ